MEVMSDVGTYLRHSMLNCLLYTELLQKRLVRKPATPDTLAMHQQKGFPVGDDFVFSASALTSWLGLVH